MKDKRERDREGLIGEKGRVGGKMYRERGVGGSRSEVGVGVGVGPQLDRKQRINEALDKQLERSSPSTSRPSLINGKDKSVFMPKPPPDHRDSLPNNNNNNCSDGI